MTCPCCSGNAYKDCCQPYHLKAKFPATAEALMRSRFSAFAIPNSEYLWETTSPNKRQFHHKKDLQEWGEINVWTKLEIVDKPSANKVEFKAFYIDEDGNEQVHHELSKFKFIRNRWYYVSGEFL